MIGGVHGKVLHIDLTTLEQHIEHMPEDFYRLLVGGRAVAAYFLLRDLPANTDPLSQDNLLIFVPGILQGTNLPGSGRHGVGAKSPLTGAIASSEAGGWWGHEFKRTGYDALIIHGRAEKPVYLWIKMILLSFEMHRTCGGRKPIRLSKPSAKNWVMIG